MPTMKPENDHLKKNGKSEFYFTHLLPNHTLISVYPGTAKNTCKTLNAVLMYTCTCARKGTSIQAQQPTRMYPMFCSPLNSPPRMMGNWGSKCWTNSHGIPGICTKTFQQLQLLQVLFRNYPNNHEHNRCCNNHSIATKSLLNYDDPVTCQRQ